MNWLSLAVLIVAGAYFLQQVYKENVPVDVVQFYNLPAKVLNTDKKVARGDYLEYEIEYKKYVDLPARISRSLVNDRVVTLTNTETGSAPVTIFHYDGRRKVIVRVKIPENIFPSRYQLETTMTYQVYKDRCHHERYNTEWFEVTP